jgi:MFS family permease
MAAPAEPVASPGLGVPAAAVRRGWISLLSIANLGLYVGYFAPLQELLPNQVQAIDPTDKTTALGVVTAFGALVAVLVGPLAGAMSDATASRFGRRRPWIAGGAVLGCAGLALLSGQHGLIGVTLGWCVAQAGLNALQAGLSAAVPDRVPVRQRGLVSGWVGLTQSLGVVVGVALVAEIVTGQVSGYLAVALLVALTAAPMVRRHPDPPVPKERLPRLRASSLFAAFRFDFRAHPDFAWAWGTRFLVQLGNSLGTLYLLYFLRDRVKYANPDDGLFILIVIYTCTTLLTVVVGGAASDRSGRRKPAVIVSGYSMAGAALLLAVWETWTGAVVCAALLGLGFGVYLSVDQALITQVLPSAEDRAKDLGIINIASSAPQVLGPALAAPIVTYLGGYPSLYISVAVVTVLGSYFVTRIRGVR